MEEVVNKVKALLFDKLDYIYCGSCRFYDDDTHCEECHRKNMNWKISEYTAEMIADYLGAARAYMGKDFTLKKELEWWENKLNTNMMMHEETKNFLSFCFCQFAFTDDVYILPMYKNAYETGVFVKNRLDPKNVLNNYV